MANKQKSQQKYDRNRKSGQNAAYKNEHRHEKSHIRRIKAHISRYGNPKCAKTALMRYAEKVGLNAFNSAQEFLKFAFVGRTPPKRIKPRYHGVAMGGTATA